MKYRSMLENALSSKKVLALLFALAIVLPAVLYTNAYAWLKIMPTNKDVFLFHYAAQAAFNFDMSPYGLVDTPDPNVTAPHVPFLYHPGAIILFAPFAFLSYEQAYVAMVLVNVVCLVGLFYLVCFRILKLTIEKDLLIIVSLLLFVGFFRPMEVQFQHGQVNLILACLLCGFWLAARKNAQLVAGALLATAVVIKTYPVLLLLFLLIDRRIKLVGTTIAFGFGYFVLSLIIFPVGLWFEWLLEVAPNGGYGKTPEGMFSPAYWSNQGINGVVSRLFVELSEQHLSENLWVRPIFVSAELARYSGYLIAFSVLGVSLWSLWRLRKKNPKAFIDMAMMIMIPMIFLLGPLAWDHHTVYVLPVSMIFVAWVLRSNSDAPSPILSIFAIVAAALLAMPMISVLWALNVTFWGVFILWASACWMAWHGRSVFEEQAERSDRKLESA